MPSPKNFRPINFKSNLCQYISRPANITLTKYWRCSWRAREFQACTRTDDCAHAPTHTHTHTGNVNLRAQVVVDPEPASTELVPRELESRLPTRGGSNGAAKHEGVFVHMVYRETPVGCLAARIRDRYYAGLIG